MNYLHYLFNLHSDEEDKVRVLQNVRMNIYFRGAKLWILVCAIFIASVGLNINSTAAVIGAMLISPLMGPIIGAGFGLSIYDFNLLKKSLKNLLVATIVGLIVSAIYFYISPFKQAHSELLARTSPTIYDVLIAFFGGLAGIIAVTRVEKGLPVAGVAIATALMPPLCTAGYGLAVENYSYFFGALYLYSINCVFICIGTYVVVKYMNYPAIKIVDKKHAKQVKYGISLMILLMIVPSSYFAYELFKEQRFVQNVDSFLRNEFESKGDIIVYKKINYNESPKKIEIAFLLKQLTKNDIDTIKNTLPQYNLQHTRLIIRQDTANIFTAKNSDKAENIIDEKDILISKLKQQIAKNTYDNQKLLDEAKVFFPAIANFSISNHTIPVNDSMQQTVPVLIYTSNKKLNPNQRTELEEWLKHRLNSEVLEIYERIQE